MHLDVRRNPALLKLDLYCKGMRIDDSCLVEQDGGRKILRTRAGLGSGLEVVLPGGLWTNVPVTEKVRAVLAVRPAPAERRVRASARRRGGVRRSSCRRGRSGTTRRQTTGKPMTRVGTLQGTYLGVYPAKVCEYWTEKPQKSNCKFCSVGLNLGVDDADDKSVNEVMEVIRAARERVRPHLRRLQHRPLRGRHLPRHPRAVHPAHQEGGRDPRRRADAAAPGPQALRRAARDGRESRVVLLRDLRPLRVQGGLPGQGPAVRPAALPRRGRVLREARQEGALERAVGDERRDHRRPRASGVVDPGDRLDHVRRRDPHGVRVPAARRDGLLRHAPLRRRSR